MSWKGRLKVFVYELPSKYNRKLLHKDERCLNHMFAAEIYMHRFLLFESCLNSQSRGSILVLHPDIHDL